MVLTDICGCADVHNLNQSGAVGVDAHRRMSSVGTARTHFGDFGIVAQRQQARHLKQGFGVAVAIEFRLFGGERKAHSLVGGNVDVEQNHIAVVGEH